MGESYQADLSAVRSVIQQMLDASSARDLEAFVDLFTEDVIVMVPDRLPIIGKDAWRATVQGPFERSTVEQLNMPSEEIVIAGDWAFERHNETVVLVDRANGQRRRAHAKGIWILRRQADGSWKFARYIYNVSPPPEADTRLPYIETKPRSEEHI